jgi:4-aminobutyrate aminotransferase-like enzyme
MADQAGKNSAMPWYAKGLEHIWLPYAQMKTVLPPLAVVRTQGTRITLADGRELIDGIASWWTACHGYNHPHIRQAVEAQLASCKTSAGRSHPRVLLGLRFCRCRSRHEDGDTILDQPRHPGQKPVRGIQGRVPW